VSGMLFKVVLAYYPGSLVQIDTLERWPGFCKRATIKLFESDGMPTGSSKPNQVPLLVVGAHFRSLPDSLNTCFDLTTSGGTRCDGQ
jgi:hypothetical protein